jgi:hypothetical protein
LPERSGSPLLEGVESQVPCNGEQPRGKAGLCRVIGVEIHISSQKRLLCHVFAIVAPHQVVNEGKHRPLIPLDQNAESLHVTGGNMSDCFKFITHARRACWAIAPVFPVIQPRREKVPARAEHFARDSHRDGRVRRTPA